MTATTQLFANNVGSTLAVAANAAQTTLTLATGTGGQFPSPGAGQFFVATIYDAATSLLTEIVWVTAISGDVLTVVRAQEGTTAQSWLVGDRLSLFLTEGTLANLVQVSATPASIGLSGYDTSPSGVIRQWGTGTCSGGGATVTFPEPFPNNCFSLKAWDANGAAWSPTNISLFTVNHAIPLDKISNAVVQAVWNGSGFSTSTGTGTFFWEALGD